MAQKRRFHLLETRSARLKLPIAKNPVFVKVTAGVSLGYRRNQSAGPWIVALALPKGKRWTKSFAVADDFETANGTAILDFWQAQEHAQDVMR